MHVHAAAGYCIPETRQVRLTNSSNASDNSSKSIRCLRASHAVVETIKEGSQYPAEQIRSECSGYASLQLRAVNRKAA